MTNFIGDFHMAHLFDEARDAFANYLKSGVPAELRKAYVETMLRAWFAVLRQEECDDTAADVLRRMAAEIPGRKLRPTPAPMPMRPARFEAAARVARECLVIATWALGIIAGLVIVARGLP